ncbi:MAG: NAD(P)H-hydrate dehydratase [Helicobacteraceae bacterium]|nr:NAD(P)H-hydrate dehydratase [Helicobacteraceae bacterium]
MVALYESVEHLDKRAVESFFMSEELLMEHAALAMKREIISRFPSGAKVLIVSGSGNNGADGLALARLLAMEKGFLPSVYLPFGTSTWLGSKQLERLKALGIESVGEIRECDVLVDALFGSGFKRKLEDEGATVILSAMNSLRAFKIACDIPSGVSVDGSFGITAKVDLTVTMGAPKLVLFTDRIKDFAGRIIVGDLGLPKEAFAAHSDSFLLERSDMKLPLRNVQDSHKGSYGHLAVVMGDKPGAALLSAFASMRFGAGLTTVITKSRVQQLPPDLIQVRRPLAGTLAIAVGMGLGEAYVDEEITAMIADLPVVIDADALYRPFTLDLIKSGRNVVLTPHPKEFAALLRLCDLGEYTIEEVQENRLALSLTFSNTFPNAILILKGANVIVANGRRRFLNPLGSPVLAKGGSGDVLSGMVGSLIAQGYSPLEAAINASLAHTIAASNFKGANYSMTPSDLIEELRYLA